MDINRLPICPSGRVMVFPRRTAYTPGEELNIQVWVWNATGQTRDFSLEGLVHHIESDSLMIVDPLDPAPGVSRFRLGPWQETVLGYVGALPVTGVLLAVLLGDHSSGIPLALADLSVAILDPPQT